MPEPSVAFPRGKTTFERPIDPREKIPAILRHSSESLRYLFRSLLVTAIVAKSKWLVERLPRAPITELVD